MYRIGPWLARNVCRQSLKLFNQFNHLWLINTCDLALHFGLFWPLKVYRTGAFSEPTIRHKIARLKRAMKLRRVKMNLYFLHQV